MWYDIITNRFLGLDIGDLTERLPSVIVWILLTRFQEEKS